MHGVPGWMLYREFDPGFWGSVSVSLLLLHNSSYTTARHVLKPSYVPVVVLDQKKLKCASVEIHDLLPPNPRTAM